MRDYTRKAKRVDNGKWIIGYLVSCDERYFISEVPECDTCKYMYEGYWFGTFYEVDPDTICNPTGLTDKNGNKIWENDVVCTPYVDPVFGDMVNDKILDDYTWKVVFVDGGFCVENEDKIINLRSFTNGNHIKAIGNIFDNACIDELLKGEEG